MVGAMHLRTLLVLTMLIAANAAPENDSSNTASELRQIQDCQFGTLYEAMKTKTYAAGCGKMTAADIKAMTTATATTFCQCSGGYYADIQTLFAATCTNTTYAATYNAIKANMSAIPTSDYKMAMMSCHKAGSTYCAGTLAPLTANMETLPPKLTAVETNILCANKNCVDQLYGAYFMTYTSSVSQSALATMVMNYGGFCASDILGDKTACANGAGPLSNFGTKKVSGMTKDNINTDLKTLCEDPVITCFDEFGPMSQGCGKKGADYCAAANYPSLNSTMTYGEATEAANKALAGIVGAACGSLAPNSDTSIFAMQTCPAACKELLKTLEKEQGCCVFSSLYLTSPQLLGRIQLADCGYWAGNACENTAQSLKVCDEYTNLAYTYFAKFAGEFSYAMLTDLNLQYTGKTLQFVLTEFEDLGSGKGTMLCAEAPLPDTFQKTKELQDKIASTSKNVKMATMSTVGNAPVSITGSNFKTSVGSVGMDNLVEVSLKTDFQYTAASEKELRDFFVGMGASQIAVKTKSRRSFVESAAETFHLRQSGIIDKVMLVSSNSMLSKRMSNMMKDDTIMGVYVANLPSTSVIKVALGSQKFSDWANVKGSASTRVMAPTQTFLFAVVACVMALTSTYMF